ncbi:MAG: ABC transporter ATP-binding protein [Chloroflexi bacterium]|nr:ABC transporter ATP-binding protein [Chloroflexota bacterium]
MGVSVRFQNVSKRFVLYTGRSRTLQEQVQDLFLQSRNRVLPPKKDFWALQDVSFDIEQGHTVGLVGSNGSGKSTALKLIARILEPSSGSVQVNGRVSALLELGAGFHPDLTGRENIYLNGSLMGIQRKRLKQVFDEIVEFSELEQFIDMPVKHYSSGMYTRLAFAVSIHVDPEILLVDEVLAVGDGAFQRKCMESIGELRRSGVTILLVSHDLETVARLCHTAVWLDKGEVHAIGEGRLVINDYIAHINEQQQALLARTQKQRGESQQTDDESEQNESAADVVEETIEVVPPKDGVITQIETLDADGNTVKSILSGSALHIRVHYAAHRRIETPVFGLALHRDDGVHITGPNTQSGGYPIDAIEGEGFVDYFLTSVPLTAGRFYVSASLVDQACTYFYDYRDQAHSFVVQPRSVWDQLGVVKFDGQWRLTAVCSPETETLPFLETSKS